MKLNRILTAAALAVAASASFADTFTGPIDLSSGNANFGRNNAVGSFVDTYTFSLLSLTSLLAGTAGTSASGDQNLDFTSLVIENSANAIVATFLGNFGTPANELYSLPSTLLAAGNYKLMVTGVNSPTQASYAGNLAISAAAVPEPETYALMLAGLSAMGFVARRRKG